VQPRQTETVEASHLRAASVLHSALPAAAVPVGAASCVPWLHVPLAAAAVLAASLRQRCTRCCTRHCHHRTQGVSPALCCTSAVAAAAGTAVVASAAAAVGTVAAAAVAAAAAAFVAVVAAD